MVVTMFLAHLVGDYVLQWDNLARWKSRELKGVLAHGLMVGGVTWLLSLPFDPGWWPWVLAVWLTHTAVDAVSLVLGRRVSLNGTGMAALVRFHIDQWCTPFGICGVREFTCWLHLAGLRHNERI